MTAGVVTAGRVAADVERAAAVARQEEHLVAVLAPAMRTLPRSKARRGGGGAAGADILPM